MLTIVCWLDPALRLRASSLNTERPRRYQWDARDARGWEFWKSTSATSARISTSNLQGADKDLDADPTSVICCFERSPNYKPVARRNASLILSCQPGPSS